MCQSVVLEVVVITLSLREWTAWERSLSHSSMKHPHSTVTISDRFIYYNKFIYCKVPVR